MLPCNERKRKEIADGIRKTIHSDVTDFPSCSLETKFIFDTCRPRAFFGENVHRVLARSNHGQDHQLHNLCLH